MNQVLPLFDALPAIDQDEYCRQQAEVIRALAKRTMHDMIEIGTRLADVKGRLSHGLWLPWLRAEFDWTDRTARNFIEVSRRFSRLETVSNLPALAIDATALYLLSKPDMPEAVRETAITSAKTGKKITLADAEKMVAEHVAAAVREVQTGAEAKIDDAVAERDDLARQLAVALETKPPVIPTIEDALKTLCKITGNGKPSPRMVQALADALDTPIAYGDKIYPAATAERSVRAENDLKVGAAFIRTLGYFVSDAPPPEQVYRASQQFMRDSALKQLPAAIEWLTAYRILLEQKGDKNG